MKMMDIWGYRLCIQLNDKGIRACHRYASHSCTLYDKSYYCAFRFLPTTQLLQQVGLAKPLKLNSFASGLIYQDNRLVCPVDLLLTQESLMVFVHPAAYEEFKELYGHEGIDLKDQLAWISLSGPAALNVLCKVLNLVDPDIAELFYEASALCSSIFPDGATLGCNISIPSQRGPMHTPAKAQNIEEPREDFVPRAIPNILLRAMLSWPQTAGTTALWQMLEPGKFTSAPKALTTRSKRARYPKPVKSAKGEKKEVVKAPMPEVSQPAEVQQTPIVLLFQKSNLKRGFAATWNLMCSTEHSLQLWR